MHKSDEKFNSGRFKCTGCGKCCTGFDGQVWLSVTEIETLANRFKLSEEDFLAKYTYMIGHRASLNQLPKEQGYDCIFLKDKKICTIYEDRPRQCRTYPFWNWITDSEENWLAEKEHCEGIDHPDGELIQFGD